MIYKKKRKRKDGVKRRATRRQSKARRAGFSMPSFRKRLLGAEI